MAFTKTTITADELREYHAHLMDTHDKMDPHSGCEYDGYCDCDICREVVPRILTAADELDRLKALYEPYREIDKTIDQMSENDPEWLDKLASMCIGILTVHLVESGAENQFSTVTERDGRNIEVIVRYVDGRSLTERVYELENAVKWAAQRFHRCGDFVGSNMVMIEAGLRERAGDGD